MGSPHLQTIFLPMPRQLRPYYPGGTFHVTARTQGGQRWFDEATRDFICESIARVQRRTDSKLIAFVVMPNHFHLVVQQGDLALARIMHPLLTRVAMSVKKKYDLVGHVFGSRYWSHPCATTEYLQTCVAYVHFNPVKAAICGSPVEYMWSSAACYDGGSAPRGVVIEPISLTIATSPLPLLLPFNFQATTRPIRSMENVVMSAIREYGIEIDIDTLRWMRGKIAATLRRICICRAVEAGYSNSQIARYMCVSDSAVSRVAVQVRGNTALKAKCQNRSEMVGE
jgi:REP element-mobilizing transposase RayT